MGAESRRFIVGSEDLKVCVCGVGVGGGGGGGGGEAAFLFKLYFSLFLTGATSVHAPLSADVSYVE